MYSRRLHFTSLLLCTLILPIAHLEDDPDPDSEYSYPAIVKTENGIAISYTWNRTNIRCWQIPDNLLN